MPVLNNVLAGAAGQSGGAAADFTIERSLRFNTSDNAHLHKNFGTIGNRKTWTYSTWVKRSKLGAEQMFGIERQNGAGAGYEYLRFDSSDRIDLYVTHDGSGWSGRLQTEAVYRDVSAWLNVILVCDIENSTQSDRLRLYVNGERITTFNAAVYPATTEQTTINSTGNHHIGMITGSQNFFGGYLAETHFLDGIAISNPDGVFGEFSSTTGVWNPIEANITSPNNGTTWSSTLTATSAHSSGNPASYGFDGIPSASDPNTFLAGAGGDCVWNASSYGFTNVKVEVYVFGSGGSLRQWQVNGGTAINEATSAGWQNLGTYSTLSEIRCNGVGGGYGGAISAIRLNGITLVDGAGAHGKNGFHLDFSDASSDASLGYDAAGTNNWNVNNITASAGQEVTVANATGALPVLNTTGDQGATANSPQTARSDSNSAYLELAAPLDTLTDFSGNSRTIGGSGVTLSSSRYRFYGASAYFDGNSQLTIQNVNNIFDFGTGDFTVEVWARPSGTGGDQYILSWECSGPNAGHAGFNIYNGAWRLGAFNNDVVGGNTGLASGEWVHLAMARQGTTLRTFINGALAGSKTNNDNMSATTDLTLGKYAGNATLRFTGYMQDFRVYKGVAKYTSAFSPPALANNTAAAGTDSLLDSPTNYNNETNIGGNFCTWNSIAKFTGVAGISQPIVYSQGNLQAKISSGSTWSPGCGTIAVDSGKWYAEFTVADLGGANHFHVGINPPLSHFVGVTYHSAAGTGHWYGSNGQMWDNGSPGTAGAVASANNGDIIGIALDFDAGTVTFYKNGTSLTSVSLNDNIKTQGAVFGFDLYPTCSVIANWGQRPFRYPVSGFKTLCTENIDAPIEKSSEQFDIALWDGDGANSRTIPTDHEPEFVWVRARNLNGRSHYLYDALRGFGANKELVTDATNEEGSNSHLTQNHGYVSGTTASGFTLAAGATNSTYTNDSGNSYVGWVWNAASSTTSVSAGALNSSTYTQDDVYSDDLTTSGSASGSVTNAFDGNLTTQYSTATGGAYTNPITFTPSGGLSYTSSVKVYCPSGQMAARINGGSWVSFTTDAVIATGSGSITTLEVTERRSSAGFGLYAIEVDGKILVDSNITPPNVPTQACTQRANPTAGFSIVNYVGTNSNISISHGLSKPPEFIVIKSRDSTQPWVIGHKDIGWTHYLHYSADIANALSAVWQDTAPTSSVFTVGATGGVNANNENMLALCWHGVEGFSKFGSYIGTGSDPGTFQHTGFKVRFLWLKTVDTGPAHWYIYDSERDPINITDQNIVLNLNGTEGTTSNKIDLLSNGWIPRSGGTSSNLSGRKYIWCAFAENPLKYARAH